MQSFHSSIHHFRKSSTFADITHSDTLLTKQACRSTRGKKGEAMIIDKGTGKWNETGFVTNG
jgi:hypothetical protein